MRIIRNIIKMTDPKDDGLRMPLPPASLKKKKTKKKKK
jgi:F-box/leucine-rich repeat protein 2/20